MPLVCKGLGGSVRIRQKIEARRGNNGQPLLGRISSLFCIFLLFPISFSMSILSLSCIHSIFMLFFQKEAEEHMVFSSFITIFLTFERKFISLLLLSSPLFTSFSLLFTSSHIQTCLLQCSFVIPCLLLHSDPMMKRK